ncbi:MAG: hypothetical protein ACYC1P_04735 [Gaiellaceae bacterium]
MSTTKPRTTIKTKVTFPVSKKGPFSEDYPPETTVGTVRAAAMEHFNVADDAQFAYVLTHDGQRQEPATTLGSIAGEKRKVDFRLVKVITQG